MSCCDAPQTRKRNLKKAGVAYEKDVAWQKLTCQTNPD